MKHYVYKLIDPKTNEFYIGSRSFDGEIENDKYMGSYVTWEPKDKNRLVKIIIEDNFTTREQASLYEKKLVRKYIKDPLNRNYSVPAAEYYTIDGKVGYWNGKTGPMKGRKHTEEAKRKMREAKLGRKLSTETKEKMSEAHVGKSKSKEHRKALSMSLSGVPKSKEHRKALSDAHRGRKLTEEHKRKISEANKRRWAKIKNNETK